VPTAPRGPPTRRHLDDHAASALRAEPGRVDDPQASGAELVVTFVSGFAAPRAVRTALSHGLMLRGGNFAGGLHRSVVEVVHGPGGHSVGHGVSLRARGPRCHSVRFAALGHSASFRTRHSASLPAPSHSVPFRTRRRSARFAALSHSASLRARSHGSRLGALGHSASKARRHKARSGTLGQRVPLRTGHHGAQSGALGHSAPLKARRHSARLGALDHRVPFRALGRSVPLGAVGHSDSLRALMGILRSASMLRSWLAGRPRLVR
jgi:hypothetical protein